MTTETQIPPNEVWQSVTDDLDRLLVDNPELLQQTLSSGAFAKAIDNFALLPKTTPNPVESYMMGMWDCHELYRNHNPDDIDSQTEVLKVIVIMYAAMIASDPPTP